MKLFLALAFVAAVAAALPEPNRLPEAVLPQAAEQQEVDAVRFVDSPLSEVAPQVKEIQFDAVKFVEASQPEVAAENPRVDAVNVFHAPLEVVQPQEFLAEDISVDAVKIADAPVAEEIQADPVKFVETPEEVAPQAEEKVDAVRFVDAPVQEEVKIAREPEFILPTPVLLPSAALPVVQDFQYGVRFVDTPQEAPIVAPVYFQPVMPLVDVNPMIVPQQIMDLIMAEQAQIDAAEQKLPVRVNVFADPMLR